MRILEFLDKNMINVIVISLFFFVKKPVLKVVTVTRLFTPRFATDCPVLFLVLFIF